MSSADILASVAIFLYGSGLGLAYALAPLFLPMSLNGRTPRRFLFAAAWPAFGFFFLLACFATNWV